MSISNAILDVGIDYGVIGGPRYNTTILRNGGGHEQRIQNWAFPLGRWQLGEKVLLKSEYEYLLNFFNARRGSLEGFWFKDWGDYRFEKKLIATGDGTETTFSFKAVSGAEVYRVDLASVDVFVANVLVSNYTILNSQIVFDSPPANGAEIKATYEFYKPVRFEQDVFEARFDYYSEDSGEQFWFISALPVVELRTDETFLQVGVAAPVIDLIAGDGIIAAAEANAGFSVTGTGTAGLTVRLTPSTGTIGGQSSVDTAVQGDGAWSVAIAEADVYTFGDNTSGSATVTFNAFQIDGNDNSLTTLRTAILAAIPSPTIDAIATDDIVNASEASTGFSIAGAGVAGLTITLTFTSGHTLAGGNTATVDSNGDWSIAVVGADVAAFLEFSETVTAVQSSSAGFLSLPATRTFTVDTVAPAAPTINVIATDDSISAAEASTGFSITGTGEVGATVTLAFTSSHTLAGGNTATVDANGDWSIAVVSADVTAFGQGSETVTATQTDVVGNTSATATRTFTVE